MLIAGAGGHAVEVLDVLLESYPRKSIAFFDDVTEIKFVHGIFPVLKSLHEAKSWLQRDPHFCLGVGKPALRRALYSKLIGVGGQLVGIKAKSAVVSGFAGNFSWPIDLMCQSFISCCTQIGIGTLINHGVKVHHNVGIGEFCEIGPGAILLGAVEIGNDCLIGAGATILPKVKLAKNVVVGAGAVVTIDLTLAGIYGGVPAKRLK